MITKKYIDKKYILKLRKKYKYSLKEILAELKDSEEINGSVIEWEAFKELVYNSNISQEKKQIIINKINN